MDAKSTMLSYVIILPYFYFLVIVFKYVFVITTL